MKTLTLFTLVVYLTVSCAEPQYSTVVRTPRYRADSGRLGYFDKSNFSKEENKIVLYSASLTIVVMNPDTLNSRLVGISKKYNGYAVSLGNKSSIIRVNAENLAATLDEISRHGKIKNKTISGNDVTDEYKDYEIRLENAEKARQRYLELLQKAENVEAALKVEKELERLNGEIDGLKGKLGRLKHLSDFSTITIYIEQKHKLGLLGYVGKGLYEAVKWLIVRD